MTLKELSENNALLITTDVNRYYLSGFPSSLGYLFIIGGRKILYVDGRYIEAAKSGVYADVEVRLLNKLSDTAKEITDGFKIKKVLLEAEISVRELNNLKKMFAGTECEASEELSDIIEEKRAVKTENEVNNIIKAQRIAEAGFDEILNFIRVGVSEREIALELEYRMRKCGAEGISFDTIAICGINTSKPHGVPGDRKVQSGDFVTMDFGAVYGGYHSDMTRTVAVGSATDEMYKVYNTVLNAQIKGIEKMAAGVMCSEVDNTAREIIKFAGYGKYFNHSTGHGVGLEIHENPNLSPLSKRVLQAGNVVTCEPGIYIEGKFGVRIEDMILINDRKDDNFSIRNLTKSQKDLIILK